MLIVIIITTMAMKATNIIFVCAKNFTSFVGFFVFSFFATIIENSYFYK